MAIIGFLAVTAVGMAAGAAPANAADAPPSDVEAITAALVATTTSQHLTAIERGHVQAALRSVQAGYTDVLGTVSPEPGTVSVSFDNGRATPSGLPDYFGARVGLLAVTADGLGHVGAIVTAAGASIVCSVDVSIATAAALLDATPNDLACPTAPIAGSAITTMWAWGNSVDPAVDNRGLGQPGMAPAAMAAFATAHHLTGVYLSVPWAANQGAIEAWLNDSVTTLHAAGVSVSALGGDTAWVDSPALAAQWITDARAAAPFDAIQLDVEPWAGAAEPDFATITPGLIALLGAARTAAGPVSLGIDLPWWTAMKQYGTGTVFDALVPLVDTVAIVAFSDHAFGADGIVQLATPAADAAVAAGTPFTIGVETDTPAIAGGAQYTFFDEGPVALEAAASQVRATFAAASGYSGVTVEHLQAWTSLIGAES